MNGIMLIDKEPYKTSSQLILEIKKKYNFKKIGHAGTLDPLATGLLVILINKATKLSSYLLNADKKYLVEMRLFIRTNSGDITGKFIDIKPYKIFSNKTIISILNYFNGFIYDQYPPIFSAIKYKGKKLYEYAYNKQKIEINPRKVTIKKIKFLSYNKKTSIVKFVVECSKGTYIRSLVEDIAKKLKTVATVYKLKRLKSGNFSISNAKKIKDLNPKNDLISMYDGILKSEYPIINYHNETIIKHGKPITIINHSNPIVFIKNKNNDLIAIYKHVVDHLYICIRGI